MHAVLYAPGRAVLLCRGYASTILNETPSDVIAHAHKWQDNAWLGSSRRGARPFPRVVSHLHNPVKQFLGGRCAVRSGGLFRLGDGLDECVTVEGIDLVESDDRHHQPITHLRRRDRTAQTDDDIDVNVMEK
jgi:hypothetical protein